MRLGLSLLLFIALSGCATIQMPEGGDKDIAPPKLLRSTPDTLGTQFHGSELTFEFDEYFSIHNFQKTFLLTPPLNKPVTYLIRGKKLIIKMPEKLQEQTTYQMYFGDCIRDIHEANILKHFTFVLTTGAYIDSSTLRGQIHFNGFQRKTDQYKVFLYPEISDSTLQKGKPLYITLPDSSGAFLFQYLKKGSYFATAINDQNGNNIPDAGETIAFHFQSESTDSGRVQLYVSNNDDRDSSFYIKKILQHSFLHYTAITNPSLLNPILHYRKYPENNVQPVQYQKYNDSGDSLHFYLPMQDSAAFDSLEILFYIGDSSGSKTIRNHPKTGKHLFQFSSSSAFQKPKHPIQLRISFPLDSTYCIVPNLFDPVDSTQVSIDSVHFQMPYCSIYPSKPLKESHRYQIIPMLNQPFTTAQHLFSEPDTLTINTSSRNNTASLSFSIQNTSGSLLIIQLIKNDQVHYQQGIQIDTLLHIDYLDPGVYSLQAIIDYNADQKYTHGSLRYRRMPERILILESKLELKADWLISNLQYKVE